MAASQPYFGGCHQPPVTSGIVSATFVYFPDASVTPGCAIIRDIHAGNNHEIRMRTRRLIAAPLAFMDTKGEQAGSEPTRRMRDEVEYDYPLTEISQILRLRISTCNGLPSHTPKLIVPSLDAELVSMLTGAPLT